MPGMVVLVLHAHLPYVRHPEHPRSLEETWLFEAVADCYLPLLHLLRRLSQDGLPFRITVSLSPTLLAMWNDALLRERCAGYLAARCELGRRELVRTSSDPDLAGLARFHLDRFEERRSWYENDFGRDLGRAFGELEAAGHVELITTAATHAFLPAVEPAGAVRAQIAIGLEEHRRFFGQRPAGFWLPECGYSDAVGKQLAEAGVRYTFLDTHGLTKAVPAPRFACYAPALTEPGLAVLARDPETSEQVWSAEVGYPGDPVYREFHRDIGLELEAEAIGEALRPSGRPGFTGFKYHRVTGREPKELYQPEVARAKAIEHARDFARRRVSQAASLQEKMGQQPVIVAPYDAELFGHWWFEGPQFLEQAIRELAASEVRLVTASDILKANPILQLCKPAESSWGRGGDARTWLNSRTAWVVAECNQAAATLVRLSGPNSESKALRQAARELLLAQSSDWQFMISNRTFADYAADRVHKHLEAFHALVEGLEGGSQSSSMLEQRREKWPLFEQLALQAFAG